MPVPFQRIAILGTGLIGGSFALAVRTAFPGVRITGWDKPEVLEHARALGAIHEAQAELAAAIARADLIFVALPVALAIERLPDIARLAPAASLVTDAGSTKHLVCEVAGKCFAGGALFLGGHPMAGQERPGIEAASASLFRSASYALIGEANAPRDGRVQKFVALVEAIGGHPIWMDAMTHDRAAAVASHLPQLLAVALAGLLLQQTDPSGLPLALAGRGLRDALRLAGSPYAVWRDIVLTNPANIETALDKMIQQIEYLRSHLRQRELEEEFAAANEVYRMLRDMK